MTDIINGERMWRYEQKFGDFGEVVDNITGDKITFVISSASAIKIVEAHNECVKNVRIDMIKSPMIQNRVAVGLLDNSWREEEKKSKS